MQNVTDLYLTTIEQGLREFKTRCYFGDTLVSGSDLKAILIEDSFNSDDKELKMGCAVSKKATINMFNVAGIDYNNSTIRIENGLLLPDSSIEWVEMGTYYPEKPESDDEYKTLKITAYDFMAKFNKSYTPTITAPTTDTAIVNDICTQNGITFIGETTGCAIPIIYDYTERETLGYMAGLQGKNAYITRDNKLMFGWYVMPKKWNETTGTWSSYSANKWYEIMRKENG